MEKTNDEKFLLNLLNQSHSNSFLWGKEIIFAIDLNNPSKLIKIFKTKGHLGANINERVTRRGYGGYAWTIWLHKHLG